MNFSEYFANLFPAVAQLQNFQKDILDSDCTIRSYYDVITVTTVCTIIGITGFTVPAGQTLILALLPGSRVTFTGVIKFQYSEWKGPLIQISGVGVTVIGAPGVYLDGNGPLYWDGLGDLGKTKPCFALILTTGNSIIQNMDLKNCPRQCFSIAGSDTQLIGCDVDVSAATSLGRNTDGYDVSGSGIVISSATVTNQDDCVAINAGTNINITNINCFNGHGLSLSVKNDLVSFVNFKNCKVFDSRNGIHVKTKTDGTGTISNVEYDDITLSGITYYGINVQQDYRNGNSTGNPTSKVIIKNLNLRNVHGSMNGFKDTTPVYILCGVGTCSGWQWSQIAITNAKKPCNVNYRPPGLNC